jgi:hypothetical protein
MPRKMEKATEARMKELERRVIRLERILYRFCCQVPKDLGEKHCCDGDLLPIEYLAQTKTPLGEIIG